MKTSHPFCLLGPASLALQIEALRTCPGIESILAYGVTPELATRMMEVRARDIAFRVAAGITLLFLGYSGSDALGAWGRHSRSPSADAAKLTQAVSRESGSAGPRIRRTTWTKSIARAVRNRLEPVRRNL